MPRLIAVIVALLALLGAGWWGWSYPELLPESLRAHLPNARPEIAATRPIPRPAPVTPAPPVAPTPTATPVPQDAPLPAESPKLVDWDSARRTVTRDSDSCWHRSRSLGSAWPGCRTPRSIRFCTAWRRRA